MLLDQEKDKDQAQKDRSAYDVRVVKTKHLRVRKLPMSDAHVLTTVPEGAILHVAKNRSTKDWLYVVSVLNENGDVFDGYVMKEYTEVV